MELLQLQYFVVTAKEQNMTRAAELLHIAQPALSQSVKRLEEEMGVRLFDRIGKRIRLNDAGRELLRTAEPMLATLSTMPETLQAIAAEEAQTISLNGQGEVRLAAGTQKLMEEEIYLAVPAASRFADREEITLQEVRNEPFLTFPVNMPYHNLCNRMWGESGISPRVSLESDNPQSLKDLLAAGMGVAFWPQFSWGEADKSQIHLLHLIKPKASRIVTVTQNPKRRISKAAEDFLRFSIAYFENGRKQP